MSYIFTYATLNPPIFTISSYFRIPIAFFSILCNLAYSEIKGLESRGLDSAYEIASAAYFLPSLFIFVFLVLVIIFPSDLNNKYELTLLCLSLCNLYYLGEFLLLMMIGLLSSNLFLFQK